MCIRDRSISPVNLPLVVSMLPSSSILKLPLAVTSPSSCIWSVSYTHLDVYKRQGVLLVVQIIVDAFAPVKRLIHHPVSLAAVQLRHRAIVHIPVSYTHLFLYLMGACTGLSAQTNYFVSSKGSDKNNGSRCV